METTLIEKTWGEREGVTLDLLKKFTLKGDPDFGEVRALWAYRGDGTETGDRHLRSLLSEDAYEHHHWDTVACNRGVLVVVPRWKSSPERGRIPSPGAEYWWAMKMVADKEPEAEAKIRPANTIETAFVVPETQELLAELPGLEYMHISKVSYFSTSKRGKQWKRAPQDAMFFRFAAGYGMVAIENVRSSTPRNP